MIIEQILTRPMQVFSYVVGCEKTGLAVVIDPAGDQEDIKARADDQGLEIVKIVNTHGHADHTCGNQRLKELTGADIVISRADAGLMQSAHSRQLAASLGCALSPPPDQTVEDGELITAGQEVSLKVIATPGHSPGGICLYTPGHVFTGDTLFVGAVGRTDLPGGSWPTMLAAITERILTLPDQTMVWPGHHYGHAPSSTVKEQREHNSFLH